MHSVAIVGTGPVGSSAGMALRRRGVTVHLFDDDPGAARAAEARGAGTVGAPEGPADLALLAVPASRLADTLAEHQARGTARFYTDVSGVKVRTYREAERRGCDPTTLIGGHPLVGDGAFEAGAARADLFEDRTWALTPGPRTGTGALNCALELVALCGAVSVLLDPAAHDRAVALVSHAPRLVASLAAGRLLDAEASAIRLVDEDLRQLTRTAGGPLEQWAEALTANAGPVADQLDHWAAEARAVAAELRGLDTVGGAALPDRLGAALRRGMAGRRRIAGP